jgi:molecular chaperone DnaK (HSP70)
MKLGVDFGTTYTRLACFNQQTNALELVRYPAAPDDQPAIPTSVAYRNQQHDTAIAIGTAAQSAAANLPDTLLCETFKPLLQLQPEQGHQYAWNINRSPAEVTRDYFRLLLQEVEGSIEYGAISSLVVSVPVAWQRTPGTAAETLRQLLVDDLQLPVDYLCSEAVCAAACYVYAEQLIRGRSQQPFNLLVCDMGGRTFDVALCRVVPLQDRYKIDLLDFESSEPSDLGVAGVAFDYMVTYMAHQRLYGVPPDPNAADFMAALRAFENAKIRQHTEAHRLFEMVNRSPAHATYLSDTPLYQWQQQYQVTLEQVQECFVPIRADIVSVLERLLVRTAQQWSIDRVALVGGFSQFPLVEQTIREYLGHRQVTDDHPNPIMHNDTSRVYAVAYGAALIAHNIIQVGAYYPHTLEVIVYRNRPTLTELALPLVEAGRMLAGRARPCYAQLKNQDVIVTVQRQEYGRLPVQVRLLGAGSPLELQIPEAEYPPPGRYRVGVLVDQSNRGTLLFDPVEGGAPCRYPLGDINPALTIEND